MRRPSEIDALVAHFGYPTAAKETDGGWWSSCPVPREDENGPVDCGRGLFVKRLEDGTVRFEPICGHSPQEVVAALAVAAPTANGKPDGRRLVLTDLATVRPRPVRWLWQHRIPLGAPTLLAGKPKLGKSTLAHDLAAKVTTGTLDGDLEGTPAGVLVVTFEDLVAETVVPRLTAAGAALERVRTVEVERDGERDLVSLPDDLAGIEGAVADLGARLLIVDPLMAALAGETNTHRDHHVRRVLGPVAKLAERNDLAVLTIMHLNKGQGADLIGRIGGSVAFTGAARSLLVFGADPADPDGEDGAARVLAQRGNLAKRAPSLAYRIEGQVIDGPDGSIETSRLVCLGESDAHADELLAAVASTEERMDRDAAVDFLRSELENGPRPVKEVRAAAKDAGISDRTLDRAKSQLRVKSERVGEHGRGGGHWEWSIKDANPLGAHNDAGVGALNANPHQERDSGGPERLSTPNPGVGALNGSGGLAHTPPCSCLRPADVTSDGRCGRCWGTVTGGAA